MTSKRFEMPMHISQRSEATMQALIQYGIDVGDFDRMADISDFVEEYDIGWLVFDPEYDEIYLESTDGRNSIKTIAMKTGTDITVVGLEINGDASAIHEGTLLEVLNQLSPCWEI